MKPCALEFRNDEVPFDIQMRDLLPPEITNELRDHFQAAVARAEANYRFSAADEDSLTGALGQELIRTSTIFLTGVGVVSISSTYYKIRGRGPGAPEKATGVDGIFQIEVIRGDNGRVLRVKGLPFQAKKNWRGRDANLAAQARKFANGKGRGLVIDYTSRGYSAFDASEVAHAEGIRKRVQRRSLGVSLGNDFVNCEIGTVGTYYDPEREQFVRAATDEDIPEPSHVMHTKIIREPW